MTMTTTQPKCEICGEPMPPGEEVFKFHGYSGPCPKPPLAEKPAAASGLALIADERERQIMVEGYTPDHDDKHDRGELAVSAARYALHDVQISEAADVDLVDLISDLDEFPGSCWFKPADPIRNLVKAGALIAAEIDRRLRRDGIPPPAPAGRETGNSVSA